MSPRRSSLSWSISWTPTMSHLFTATRARNPRHSLVAACTRNVPATAPEPPSQRQLPPPLDYNLPLVTAHRPLSNSLRTASLDCTSGPQPHRCSWSVRGTTHPQASDRRRSPPTRRTPTHPPGVARLLLGSPLRRPPPISGCAGRPRVTSSWLASSAPDEVMIERTASER